MPDLPTRDQADRRPAWIRRIRRWTDRSTLGVCLITAALYVGLAMASHRVFSGQLFGHQASPLIWLPSGLSVAVLILGGLRLWPAVTLGALCASYLSSGNSLWPLAVALGNTLEAVIAAWLLDRRVAFRGDFRRQREVWSFLAYGCLLAPIASASIGASSAYALDLNSIDSLWVSATKWFFSDSIGILVFAPPLLTWARERDPAAARMGRGREAMAVGTLGALLCAMAFQTHAAPWVMLSIYASVPFVLWFTLRHGPRESTTFTWVFSLVLAWFTAQGSGPFGGHHTASTAMMWPYLVTVAVATLVVSAVIAEQRRAQRAERTGRRLLQTIVDTVPAMISVRDSDGQNLFLNRALQDFYQLSHAQQLPHEYPRGARPAKGHHRDLDLSAYITEVDRRILDSDAPMTAKKVLIQAPSSGQAHAFVVTKLPLERDSEETPHTLTIAFDVSSLEEAREARKRSEAQLRSVLQNVDGWILTTDLDGVIQYVNRPFPGNALGDILGTSIDQWIHPEDCRLVLAALVQATIQLEGTAAEARAGWGTHPWIECRMSPVDRDGVIQEITVGILDIDERKQAERERQRLNEQMQRMRNLESLGVMAGGIAHDFNNLLTGILGNAAMATGTGSVGAQGERYLRRIEGAAERAAELCQQMLDFAGKAKVDMEPRELTALVRDMVEALETLLSSRAHLHLSLSENLPPVLCDATQVRRIVMNLVTNADDSFGDTEGDLHIKTFRRRLDTPEPETSGFSQSLAAGDYIVLEVTDTGCGMAPETMGKIFDPFFTTKFTGRGLGLAAVGGIMRRHHGDVRVSSSLGQGTTFTLFFPVFEGEMPGDVLPAEVLDATGREGLVLVADDQEIVGELARAALEEAGFEVLFARDGRRALDLFDEHKCSLQLVILDRTMPEASGIEVMQTIRQERPELPVLLSSGYNEVKLQEEVQEVFGDTRVDFLRKPYRPDELVQAVRRSLGATPNPSPGDPTP